MNTLQAHIETPSAAKTMDLLWSRVRKKGNLPGFSKAVGAILAAMRGDDDREFNMTKTVLSDPVLTQRVLRLANSAMYAVFGQNINTVSRAVIVLGTDAIGHLALGLKLVEGLSSVSHESDSAKREMEKSVLAGHIARQVASSANSRDIEEAVVCAMLHDLGKMMTAFYLPEQWAAIRAYVVQHEEPESVAAEQILGLTFDDLGRRVARQWSLPDSLVNSMRDFPPQPISDPLTHTDWLAAMSSLSSTCANLIVDEDASEEALPQTLSAYSEMLGLEVTEMMAALDAAHSVASEESTLTCLTKTDPQVKRTEQAIVQPSPVDPVALLVKGVSDMGKVINGANSGQMITMALETFYNGLGLSRAISFLHNPQKSKYIARHFFGHGVQDAACELEFESAYQPDVFHASLTSNKVVLIENAASPALANKLPRWWKAGLPNSASFIVLPLVVNRQAIGFIYGDWDKAVMGSKLGSFELAALDKLRNLVAAAIEQRRKVEPSWMA